jgi:hypothetical protein
MPYVMRFICLADGSASYPEFIFLKSFDVDANDGRGEIVITDELSDAKLFDTFENAANVWKQQSAVKPFRPDGKANRPLTAYTVEFVQIEVESK